MYVRVAGIVEINGKVLLVNHNKNNSSYWVLPGGQLENNETMEDAVKREFLEETNIVVEPTKLVAFGQFLHPVRSILDIIYRCKYISGEIKLGYDPEPENKGVLSDVRLFTNDEFNRLFFRPDSARNLIFSESDEIVTLNYR